MLGRNGQLHIDRQMLNAKADELDRPLADGHARRLTARRGLLCA